MKKIAVFSDIHGNLEALQSVLENIKKENFDEVIYLGDAISIGPESKECLDLLSKSNVRYILGNHELYYLNGTDIDSSIVGEEKSHYEWVRSQLNESNRNYLKTCGLYYEYDMSNDGLPGQKLLFSHFLIENEKAPYPFEELKLRYDIDQWLKNNDNYNRIFLGHEHESYSEDIVEGVNGDFEKATGYLSNIWLVGSAGCTKNDITSYTTIEIDNHITIKRVNIKYDRETFLNKLKSTDYPDKELIAKFAYGIDLSKTK